MVEESLEYPLGLSWQEYHFRIERHPKEYYQNSFKDQSLNIEIHHPFIERAKTSVSLSKLGGHLFLVALLESDSELMNSKQSKC